MGPDQWEEDSDGKVGRGLQNPALGSGLTKLPPAVSEEQPPSWQLYLPVELRQWHRLTREQGGCRSAGPAAGSSHYPVHTGANL